jgi:hypothetical protein
MCTNAYPRIDRREEQVRLANERHPVLRGIVIDSIRFQPSERPDAKELCALLSQVRDNDRHYPVSRHVSPEKDVGVLALHWMNDQIVAECQHERLKLEQTEKMLLAEQRRVQTEAAGRDVVNQQLQQSTDECRRLTAALAEHEAGRSFQLQEQQQHVAQIEELKHQLRILATENQRSAQRERTLEVQFSAQSLDLQTAQQRLNEQGILLEQHKIIVSDYQESDQESIQRQNVLQRQLDMQVDYGRELERRLEQTLSRWKQEKESFAEDKANLKKLNIQLSATISAKQTLEEDLRLTEAKLRLYVGMPLPVSSSKSVTHNVSL